jgi:hypothetical protein
MNLASQATRIITENRIAVVKVDENSVLVQVREGPTVRVVRHHGGRWSCSCPTRTPLRASDRRATVDRDRGAATVAVRGRGLVMLWMTGGPRIFGADSLRTRIAAHMHDVAAPRSTGGSRLG